MSRPRGEDLTIATQQPVEATVVGRSCGEQLTLLTTRGRRISVRVRGRLWLELDLGKKVALDLDANGSPCSIRPLSTG
jgi:hypothetical protein